MLSSYPKNKKYVIRVNTTPIFILSLPRSGSTLLQRVLASHPDVATVPEPWLLLPLISMRRNGTYAEYGARGARRAINEFVGKLKGGEKTYHSELRKFVKRLYSQVQTQDESYFVDKTPRYHIIASDILNLFPDSRAIILWRSPLSVISSMIETWGEGRWNLHRYRVDLYHGLPSLITLAQQRRENILTVRYRDLVLDQDNEWKRVCGHLGLDLEALDWSPPSLKGKMGDPNQDKYNAVTDAPLHKWRKTLRNPFRKWWMRRYLHWLGEDRLQAMGYVLEELLHDLETVPTTGEGLVKDLYGIGAELVSPVIEHHILRDKLNKSSWKSLLSHY